MSVVGMRFKALMVASLLLVGCINASNQETGKPDISVREASKIPPFPPRQVFVTESPKGNVVTWEPLNLDNVVKYRVYRKTGPGADFKAVGTVMGPPFVDQKSPSGDVTYTVTAVNVYNAESARAKPAAKSKPDKD
jgi:hypothetical protein